MQQQKAGWIPWLFPSGCLGFHILQPERRLPACVFPQEPFSLRERGRKGGEQDENGLFILQWPLQRLFLSVFFNLSLMHLLLHIFHSSCLAWGSAAQTELFLGFAVSLKSKLICRLKCFRNQFEMSGLVGSPFKNISVLDIWKWKKVEGHRNIWETAYCFFGLQRRAAVNEFMIGLNK